MKMKIAIVGYGNLGKGVENAVLHTPDMELVAVFTRRDPATVKTRTGIPVYGMESIELMKDQIDVVILCGGFQKRLVHLYAAAVFQEYPQGTGGSRLHRRLRLFQDLYKDHSPRCPLYAGIHFPLCLRLAVERLLLHRLPDPGHECAVHIAAGGGKLDHLRGRTAHRFSASDALR